MCDGGIVLWGLSRPATFGPCKGELPGECVWHTVLGERRAWCLALQRINGID